MRIVDDNMTVQELLESILNELDGYSDEKWLPGRVKITKERIKTLTWKALGITDE